MTKLNDIRQTAQDVTAESKVKQVYPMAMCIDHTLLTLCHPFLNGEHFQIRIPDKLKPFGEVLGTGITQQAAWEAAEKNIEDGKET